MHTVTIQTARLSTHCWVSGPEDEGEGTFPSQPMIDQTRAVFERRRALGGLLRETVLHEVRHGPPLECSAEVAKLMLEHIAQ